MRTRARRASVLTIVFDVSAYMLAGSVLAELLPGATPVPQLKYAAAIVLVVAGLARVWVR